MSFRPKIEKNIDELISRKGTIRLICTSEGLRSDIFVITFRQYSSRTWWGDNGIIEGGDDNARDIALIDGNDNDEFRN